MFGVHEILVLLSEIVLSAYPLLIKLVKTSIIFQVGLRMFVFSGLAALAALLTGAPVLPATLLSAESVATGLLNLLHVSASYIGFEQLAGGNAMALFYTYPVWNLLGAAAVFGESIPLSSLPWILVALGGAVALAQPTAHSWTLLGVVAALVAALTETGIYLWFKSRKEGESDQPWTKMVQMYGSSGVFWLAGIAIALLVGFMGTNAFNISGAGLSGVLLFNGLVGFLGYALRFYLIPQVSTIVFSALSFFGVISAYGLGWLVTNEVPSALQAAGAAAIIVANAVLVTRDTA